MATGISAGFTSHNPCLGTFGSKIWSKVYLQGWYWRFVICWNA